MFFQGSAALWLLFGWAGSVACELLFVSAVQFSLLFSGHTGLLGLGGYASPPLVSYGQLDFLLTVLSGYKLTTKQ